MLMRGVISQAPRSRAAGIGEWLLTIVLSGIVGGLIGVVILAALVWFGGLQWIAEVAR
ncbi:hypothetical protein GCM10009722_39940 [Williamsia deligens]